MAGQAIGSVGTEGEGLTGLELGEEGVLRGTNGERRVVKDALGEPIRLDTVTEAEDGENVRTTLDPAIEKATEEALGEVGELWSPKGATAIVMNPQNSQVLAMANWPPVNPSDLGEADPEYLLNRATGFTYEPGSTFKAFTVSAALEEGIVTPSTTFTLPPELHVADRTIEDAEERGTVTLSVAEILAQSSNVGAVTIGLEVGSEKFSRWIDRFGFGRTTGIEFPGEEQGIVPALDEYSGSTMGNLPMGQGLSVTPIQMMAGYAAIANGGILKRPQLIEDVGGEPVHEPRGRRVISSAVAAEVREMLEGVLAAGGTASEVSVPGYTLAGKTGTAQVAENGTYSKTKYVASFIGFAPAQDPQLLVAVIVDEPHGRNLRRLGRRAGVRQDRRIRASLPRRPARIAPPVPSLESAALELGELIRELEDARLVGDPGVDVAGLAYDSRRVGEGTLFFCVVGERSDGHDFGPAAVAAGAARARRRARAAARAGGAPGRSSAMRGRRWPPSRPGSGATRPRSCGSRG